MQQLMILHRISAILSVIYAFSVFVINTCAPYKSNMSQGKSSEKKANELWDVVVQLETVGKQAKELRQQKKILQDELLECMILEQVEELELSNGTRITLENSVHVEKSRKRKR